MPEASAASGIERALSAARARLDRVAPEDLEVEVADGALVIDTRAASFREAEGALPGAIVLERNVLEWRLDPTSPDRIPEADSFERRVIVVCNEGYASSLAASSLRDLGLRRATDLIGGYRAWRVAPGRAGLSISSASGGHDQGPAPGPDPSPA